MKNSTLFANACKERGVSFELHVFTKGPHGMSLANNEWASRGYGGDYTLQYLVDQQQELPAPYNKYGPIPEGMSFKEVFRQAFKQFPESQPDEGVALWPEIAHHWLKRTFL
ncbi:hypothetical protein ACFQ88_22950 [Paenibacillus sp. NPDC056579]|uniref:hypothetical protein n=1 Tax=Paenibacillus sp. NPDC056579 TaxID=3345871 RepID=UPI00368CE2D7